MRINASSLVILFIAATLPASTVGSYDLPVRGFDAASYEYSYSGAERATDPEHWLAEARTGVAFAVARWERDAAGLYADPASLAAARIELESWTSFDIADRFSAWIRDRFFGRQAAELRFVVAEATRIANEQYLYELNTDGSIAYDEAENPRYLPLDAGPSLEDDLSAWKADTGSAVGIALDAYEAGIESLCPELLSYIPEGQRERYEPLLAAAIARASGAASCELDNLVAREERLFIARRTTDVWSLRNQSESEAASLIATALAREASTACDEGLAALEARIETATVDGGELALAGTEWLAAFKLQFDRGLSSWKNADERFMIRRLEWERDAALAFDAGNEVWASAFDTLASERQAWEARASRLFRSGEEAFSQASETLETNIREAKAEFELAAFERGTAGADRANAWVDVYLQAGAAAAGAREGAGYWLSLLGGGGPSFSDPALGLWLASEAAKPDASQQRKDWLAQAGDCLEVYTQYADKAREARDRLISDFGLAIGSDSGSLRAVLESGALAEDFCLDEYQVELIRAQAIEGYWARRVEIAAAVLRYATDLSSGRATAGDNIRNLEAASTAWSEALRLYDEAQTLLRDAGTAVVGAREAMSRAQVALKAAGVRLESVNAEYSVLMGLLLAGDTSFISDAIIAKYRDLMEQSGLSSAEGAPSESGLLLAYLEKARALGYAGDIERSGEALREAVNGMEGEPSLAELLSAWAGIRVPDDPTEAPLDAAAYGIPETDAEYTVIQALLLEMNLRLDVSGTIKERDTIQESCRLLMAKVAALAKARAAAGLESRLDGIALLGASSTGEWYAQRTGGLVLAGTLAAALASDQRAASRACLLARAELELEAIGVVSGSLAPRHASEDANNLAAWWPAAGVSAEAARASLLRLVDSIKENINADDVVFNAGIEALAGSDASIAFFARGRGFFRAAGLDIGSLHVAAELEALERACGRQAAYLRYASSAMALEEERRVVALDRLGEALAPLGLALGDKDALPEARTIVAALFSGSVDTATTLAGLLEAADQGADIAPAWMIPELVAWKDALLKYAAAKSLYLGLSLPGSSAGYRAELGNSSELILYVSTVLSGLAGDETSALSAFCLAASYPGWSAAELKVLEDETAQRIALSLRARVADFGPSSPGAEPDWSALETALTIDAESRYGFATIGIRFKAVQTALEALRCLDAVVNSRDSSHLTGAALEARLTDIWSNPGTKEAEAAAAIIAGNPISRIAYSMRALVFDVLADIAGGADRDDLLALSRPASEDEPSWLEDFYASEGQDSGATMQSLMEIAAGGDLEPWTLELARFRVDEAAVNSLSGLVAYRDGLRQDQGLASGVAERLLATFLAMSAADAGFFSWEIEALGLRCASGLEAFIGTPASDDAAMSEAFLGLGSDTFAQAAASQYLASLALSGDSATYTAYAERAGVAASARGDAIIELMAAASSYAGEYSGDTLSWALRNNPDDPAKALALVRYLESGHIDDPPNSFLGFSKNMEGAYDPVNRWISETVTGHAEQVLRGAGKTAALLVWSEACELISKQATASAASGEKHWRQYLASPAIADSGRGLPAPLLFGNPEGDCGSVPRAAAGWVEGTLADACEESERRTRALSAAFASWVNYYEDGVATAAAYLQAPEKPFDEDDVIRAPALARNEYQTAIGAYESMAYRRADTIAALTGFAKAFELASDQSAVSARLTVLEHEQISARAGCDEAMLGYQEAGAVFDAAGGEYEAAYSRTNALYRAQETARSAYELEDSILRWAGTAYLAAVDGTAPYAAADEYRSPSAELEYSRLSHERAMVNLAALEGLHAEGDPLRPYADSEYLIASADYEQNHLNLVLLAKARDALGGALDQAYTENAAAYEAYRANLFGGQQTGCPPVAIASGAYLSYVFPQETDAVTWTDFLTLRGDGSLGLAYGDDFRLTAVDASVASRLAEYFQETAAAVAEGDLQPASTYENDVREWSSRVAGYMASQSTFDTWANARDYLVASIAAANPQYGSLAGSVTHADSLYATIGQKRIDGASITEMLAGYTSGNLATVQRSAWESLGAQERADLEFYIVMSLSGGAERSSDSLEAATKLKEYEYVRGIVASRINASRRLATTLGISSTASWTLGVLLSWTPLGPALLGAAVVQFGLSLAAKADADDWQAIKTAVVDPGLETQRQTMLAGLPGLNIEVAGIQASYAVYHDSCQRISVIQGASQRGADANAELKRSLEAVAGMETPEIEGLVQLYQAYAEATASVYSGASEAVASVYRWTLSERDAARSRMENCYFDDQRARLLAQAAYRETSERYLAGTVAEAAVAATLYAAYGEQAASGKTHLTRLAEIEQSAFFDVGGDPSSREYAEAVAALATLTARASELRFASELASREAGWDLQRRDLNDRRLSWRQSASLILERGRADFEYGADLLREQATAWTKHFTDGYASLKPAWDLAYAGMQDEKLSWVARATETAGDASTEAMLALMSPDAEAAARRLDSFSVSRLDFDANAQPYYNDIMEQAGIAGMDAAFELQSGSVSTLSLAVRKGLSYAGSLDSGRIMTAAVDFAEHSRQRVSGIQARLIAGRAREAAAAAADGLAASVRQANDDFSERMAEVFLTGGMWKRQGNRYVKDIVVHSTVGTPYIIEQAGTEVFRSYALDDWSLQTDLSDGSLASLSANSVQDLIYKAQMEVQTKSEAVFGTAEESSAVAVTSRTRQIALYRSERGVIDSRIVTWVDDEGNIHTKTVDVYGMMDVFDHTEEQSEGAGEFGRHLGYAPIAKLGANPDEGEGGVFQASGSGELGRLMSSYIYWSLKEGKGWSEANKPLYEKDLWDDRGDWLQAPTIRSVADIGVTAAAGILTGGIGSLAMNLVDDAVFGFMDISGGYERWEQAGLDFGKKVALSAVNFAGGQVFGGALSNLGSSGGFNRVVGTTLLTGMRTAATSIASSAIGAVNLAYGGDGGISGFGFDTEGFKKNALSETSAASYLGSMAGAAFGASIDHGSAYSNKLWSGLTNAGSAVATEAAKYATHLGYAAARGISGTALFNEAWSAHGGITVDVANLGSLISAAGFWGGVTGSGYSASDRARYNQAAGAFSGTGLSLTIGADGVNGVLGGGGYNLVHMGMQIGKGMLLDAKLQKYAAAQGSTVESVMKTAYGYGDSAAEETVWRVVSGKDTLRLGREGGKAQTTTAPAGNRTISLMARGGGTSAILDMAVTLQHESWRDGLVGTVAAQQRETLLAARAHTGMAASIARGKEYGAAMFSIIAEDQNYQNDLSHYVNGDFASYVGRSYDSSGDFWKLTRDGRLSNDGKARLLAEVINDDGSVGWQTVEGSQAETSTAAALVHYLGAARSLELFSGSLSDLSRYDDQTLRDVLNLDDIDLKTIRNNPGEAERLIATADSGQRDKLLGEALMKGSGIKWSAEAQIWSGDGSGLTLSDRAVIGAAAIRSIGEGNYERFSITSEIERREGAYGVWMNGIKGDVGEGNTRVSFTKWDVDSGEQLATIVAGGAWNSVDNSYGQLDSKGAPIGADQTYQIAFGPTLQGNTIAEGPLNLRLAQTPKLDWGDVFIISDTKTIAGDSIMSDGRRPGYPLDYRWLGHGTKYGSSDGCPVYKRGDDVADEFDALMRSLATWGLYGGYSISGLLSDDNDFPYQRGYRKGAW